MRKLLLTTIVVMTLLFSAVAYAVPNGANVNVQGSETKSSDAASSHGAFGGNITEVNLDQNSQTLVWQGYFGEVSGALVLEDASGDVLYNWTATLAEGEVYASQSNNVTWASIAAQNDCTTDESLTGTGNDRVNNTFTASSNSEFLVGGTTIAANSACKTNTLANGAVTADFEEVLLTDGSNTVYASIMENNVAGFDAATHDFQMIVPEDNDGTTTTYYFYMELG